MDKKTLFQKTMINLSKTCTYKTPDFENEFVSDYYFERLKNYPLKKTLEVIFKLTESGRFPSVEEIKEKLSSHFKNSQINSLEITTRIKKAISRYGLYNFDEAMNYIGEVGARAIEEFGGWANLCNIETSRELDSALYKIQKLCEYRLKEKNFNLIDAPAENCEVALIDAVKRA